MIKELFEEFMELSYSPGDRQRNLTDNIIQEFILCRLSYSSLQVIFLHSGSYIEIPWKWLDVFSSFNTLFGHRVLCENVTESSDNIEKIILLFLDLLSSYAARRYQLFLSVLYKIGEIKTADFREWCKEEFGEDFEPITVISVDSIFKI